VCSDHLLQEPKEKESHFDYAKFFYTHKVWKKEDFSEDAKKKKISLHIDSYGLHEPSEACCLLTFCFGLQQQWCSSTWVSIQICDAAVVLMMGYP
jgi:hypothetical protein